MLILNWIGSLPQGAASFIGSLTGSLLGLFALIVGALFNAHLNRKRDDRLRGQERATIAAALGAELSLLEDILDKNATTLEASDDNTGSILTPDLSDFSVVYPELINKIGVLDAAAARAVIYAYAMLTDYSVTLVMMGGKIQETTKSRRMIALPAQNAKHMAKLDRNFLIKVREAQQALRPPNRTRLFRARESAT